MITSQFLESLSFLLMALPIVGFVSVWLATLSQSEDWRVGFLAAALLWGGSTLLITELLSIFSAIRPATLALVWLLIIIVSLSAIRRDRGTAEAGLLVVAMRPFALLIGDRWWVLPLIPVVAIVIATAVVALIAPPNNWDSMTYHMSRVEHWRANESVIHYPTNVVWQIYLNPWAEFAILQF